MEERRINVSTSLLFVAEIKSRARNALEAMVVPKKMIVKYRHDNYIFLNSVQPPNLNKRCFVSCQPAGSEAWDYHRSMPDIVLYSFCLNHADRIQVQSRVSTTLGASIQREIISSMCRRRQTPKGNIALWLWFATIQTWTVWCQNLFNDIWLYVIVICRWSADGCWGESHRI